MISWNDIKYFQPSEFDSPDYPGSGKELMSLELVSIVDQIRARVLKPIRITSGYRTPAHNKIVSGQPNSAHLKGLAVDLFVGGDHELRFKIVNEALKLGIVRFEIAPVHVHLDIDTTLPQNCMVFLVSYGKQPV